MEFYGMYANGYIGVGLTVHNANNFDNNYADNYAHHYATQWP